MRFVAVLPALGLMLAGPASADEAAALRLADAERIAQRAQAMAARMALNVSVVVVSREGRVILAHRMDGASIVNHELAEKKAVTAAATGVATSTLEQAVDAGKHALLSVPGVALIAGGVPVRRGDQLVGGVGVSGGAPADDEKIASGALAPE